MTKDLREYYNQLYKDGKDKQWIDYQKSNEYGLSESQYFIVESLKQRNFNPASVLDFGCGEGELLDYFKKADIRRGIDFSEVAIKAAKEKYKDVDFILGDEHAIADTYDLVTSVGVIEHLDDPKSLFDKMYAATNPGGLLYVICPNHCNTRGIIWQTLSLLFDVPMSLADKSVIEYAHIQSWIQPQDTLDFQTLGPEVSMREGMVEDLQKRLTNALGDAKMDASKVDYLLQWLRNNMDFFPISEHSGWLAVYIISKS